MTAEAKGTIMCHLCATMECRPGYPKGIPSYCVATRFHDVMEQTKTEYSVPEAVDIYKLGLCLGHDILFTRYCKAPVSTLIVKDRVTGQNPVAALYASQHRQALWKRYCDKAVD